MPIEGRASCEQGSANCFFFLSYHTPYLVRPTFSVYLGGGSLAILLDGLHGGMSSHPGGERGRRHQVRRPLTNSLLPDAVLVRLYRRPVGTACRVKLRREASAKGTNERTHTHTHTQPFFVKINKTSISYSYDGAFFGVLVSREQPANVFHLSHLVAGLHTGVYGGQALLRLRTLCKANFVIVCGITGRDGQKFVVVCVSWLTTTNIPGPEEVTQRRGNGTGYSLDIVVRIESGGRVELSNKTVNCMCFKLIMDGCLDLFGVGRRNWMARAERPPQALMQEPNHQPAYKRNGGAVHPEP